jgi:hypothetical protein
MTYSTLFGSKRLTTSPFRTPFAASISRRAPDGGFKFLVGELAFVGFREEEGLVGRGGCALSQQFRDASKFGRHARSYSMSSPAKAQRRKGERLIFLCAFAPLRDIFQQLL